MRVPFPRKNGAFKEVVLEDGDVVVEAGDVVDARLAFHSFEVELDFFAKWEVVYADDFLFGDGRSRFGWVVFGSGWSEKRLCIIRIALFQKIDIFGLF